MNVDVLQEKIIANPDYIIQILEALDYTDIRDRGRYIQFPNHDGDNLAACSILKQTLQYQNFSHSEKGNIFTLVMDEKSLNFRDSIRWIANEIGISSRELNKRFRTPFGGYYKEIQKSVDEPETSMKIYSESELEPFLHKYNMMWYNDGVDFDTQEKFNLGYSLEDNAILIPIYDVNGNLVGCKARNNDTQCEMSNRWFAYFPFHKTYIVYGYHINYHKIIEKDICIITESEKSVQQEASFCCNVGLSVLGHDISDTQTKYIKSLKTSKIIVAFDEGLEEDCIIEQCKKLVIDNKIFKNKVGYIYDGEHKYLKEGSKDSPTDGGVDIFNKLRKECIKWIN